MTCLDRHGKEAGLYVQPIRNPALKYVGGQHHVPAAISEGKTVPIAQRAGWAPVAGLDGTEHLACTGVPSPDRLACSESLHRLSYPGHRH